MNTLLACSRRQRDHSRSTRWSGESRREVQSTCPAKSSLQGVNTYGTRRTRSDHPERRANPRADAQPGRRGRARARARRLCCGAGRGPRSGRATGRGRAARVTDCEETCELSRFFIRTDFFCPTDKAAGDRLTSALRFLCLLFLGFRLLGHFLWGFLG